MSTGGDFADNWTTQLRKGILELCILSVLHKNRLYGYEIVRTLSEIDSLVISEGTIYPLLNRLKRAELVRTTIEESPGGPPRKYYELTNKGQELAQWMNGTWQRLQQGVDTLLEGSWE